MMWKFKFNNTKSSLSLDQLESQPEAIGDRLRRAYSQTPVPPDLLARIERAVDAARERSTPQAVRKTGYIGVIPPLVARPLMTAAVVLLVAAGGLGLSHNLPGGSSLRQAAPQNALAALVGGTSVQAQGAYDPRLGVVIRYHVRPSAAIADSVVRLRAVRVSAAGVPLRPQACSPALFVTARPHADVLCYRPPVMRRFARSLHVHLYAAGIQVLTMPRAMVSKRGAWFAMLRHAPERFPLKPGTVGAGGMSMNQKNSFALTVVRVRLTLEIAPRVTVTRIPAAIVRRSAGADGKAH